MAGIDLARNRNNCIKSLLECADNVSQYLSKEEQDAEIRKLLSCLSEYCALEQTETWEDIEKTIPLKKNEEGYSVDEIARLVERCCTIDQRTSDHPLIQQLMKKVNRSQAKASAAMNTSQEILVTNEIRTETIDPYSKQPIRDGVRNPLCGHLYEKAIISRIQEEYRRTGRELFCAYIGCDKPLPWTLQEMDGSQEPLNGNTQEHSFPDFIDMEP